MEYLPNSEQICGYKVKVASRPAFVVTGYTLIVPPRDDGMIPRFYDEVIADGRWDKLIAASSVRPWVLGLGSWDPECEQHGQRHTICIEQAEHTDFARLAAEYPLFTKEIGASDWLCFELTWQQFPKRFWRDNPYKMMGPLGYRFHTGDVSVGLHMDAYPPAFQPDTNPAMEFWITVVKA